ncbi:MAG: hypothetical protein O2817_08620 [Proteobacteria bacterium]|nr:hypothetical protein [Pseudomonadota bacterium]
MQADDQRIWQHLVDSPLQLVPDFLKNIFIPDDGNRALVNGNGDGFAHSGKQIAKRLNILLPTNDNKDRHRPAPDPSPPALGGNRQGKQLDRDIALDFGLYFGSGFAFFLFFGRSLGGNKQKKGQN